jgi:pyroglutamyl-peptidase
MLEGMRIIVTGFGPFGGMSHNPSETVLPLLPKRIADLEIHTAILPVETTRVQDALSELYAEKPRAVLHLGLAETRTALSLERVALNVLDFERPDNAGERREDVPVVPGAPLALSSRLPLRAILNAWRARAIPAQLSSSAGTFLCNQTMYLSLSQLPSDCPTGFIHLPPDETLGTQLGRPFVPLKLQAEALALALGLLGSDTHAPV